MKPIFLLYLFCLFVIFTPGIFFSLSNKDNLKGIILHGVLFAATVFISLKLFDRKIVEGASFTLNEETIASLVDKLNTSNSDNMPTTTNADTTDLTDENLNLIAIKKLHTEITAQNKMLRDTTNDAVMDIKKEINDYKFNTKKFDFESTQFVKNSTFDNPKQQPNSYKYINGNDIVPNWKVRNVAIVNNSKAWGFGTSYPKGNQAIAIQNKGSIITDLHLPEGMYKLSFLANGRNCCDKTGVANSLLFSLNSNLFDELTPDVTEWKTYDTKIFKIPKEGHYSLTIAGKNNTEHNGIRDKTSAIKNIKIIRE